METIQSYQQKFLPMKDVSSARHVNDGGNLKATHQPMQLLFGPEAEVYWDFFIRERMNHSTKVADNGKSLFQFSWCCDNFVAPYK